MRPIQRKTVSGKSAMSMFIADLNPSFVEISFRDLIVN